MHATIWFPVVVIAAGLAYIIFGAKRAAQRNAANRCARCGRELPEQDSTSIRMGTRGLVMKACQKCAELTTRNHRIAYYFFLCLAVGMVIIEIALVSESISKHSFVRDLEFLIDSLLIAVSSASLARVIGCSLKDGCGRDGN